VLKVPSGTQSGTTFRIKGQGVEKGEMTGDQLVKVTVQVPDHLSQEGKKVAQQLADLESLKY
jgi:molecular chaperone DnaJ